MARTLDLYINLERPAPAVLLAGRRDLTPAEPPVFVQGERPELRLQFLQPDAPGLAPEVTALEAGDVVFFALKRRATADTLLVVGSDFVAAGVGDALRYAAAVNFDTAELEKELVDEEVIHAIGEVRVQNADNTARKVWQFRCTVRRRVYAGESDPQPAIPAYPAAASLLTNGGDTATIKRGVVNLAAGQFAGIAIAFTTAFAAAPSLVRAWLMKKAGAPIITAHENHDSVTAAGFTVDLANPIPDDAAAGDYQLAWLAIL